MAEDQTKITPAQAQPTQPAGSSKKAELKPFEDWAVELETPDWQLAALIAHEKLPAGREMTRAQFTGSLESVLNAPLGGAPADTSGEAE